MRFQQPQPLLPFGMASLLIFPLLPPVITQYLLMPSLTHF
jgi:hypothetical protein